MTWQLTSMTSSAGRMPMFDNVLKKASLFWGCNVCENAQNSFRKFTYDTDKKATVKRERSKTNTSPQMNRRQKGVRPVWRTSSCLLSSSVASSVSCAKRSVRNFSSSWHQNGEDENGWTPEKGQIRKWTNDLWPTPCTVHSVCRNVKPPETYMLMPINKRTYIPGIDLETLVST